MDVKCPRKLNFNAPLLSIRRPAGGHIDDGDTACTNSQGVPWHTSDRIPFCWEQAPGKPKYSLGDNNSICDGDIVTPRPKPPPGHWRPTKATGFDNINDNDVVDDDDDDDDDVCAIKGNDDDCDDEDIEDDNEVFSSAMDVLSLTEAMDIVERKEEKGHGLEGFHLESGEHSKNPSPSFIIERFLPDATALAAAASSTLNLSKDFNKKLPNYNSCSLSDRCVSRAVRRSYPSLKGCGLEVLIPWRTKHRLCGVKSPAVCQGSSIVQPHCGSNQKKKCSSANRPFRDVNRDT